MRAISLLKQISLVVLISFVTNVTLSHLSVVYAADPANPKPTPKTLAAQIIRSEQDAAKYKQELEEELKATQRTFSTLTDEQLANVLTRMANSTLALLGEMDELQPPNVASIFRGMPIANETEQQEKSDRKMQVAKDIAGVALSVPKTLKAEARTVKHAKDLKRSKKFSKISFFVFILMSPFAVYFWKLAPVLANLDMASSDEIVVWSVDPSQLRYDVNGYQALNDGFEKNAFKKNLMSEKQIEAARDEVAAKSKNPPADFNIAYTDVFADYRASLKREVIVSVTGAAMSSLITVLAFAALGGSLAGLFYGLKQRKEDETQLARIKRIKEFFEKYFWSVLRVKFPDLPTDHDEAVKWFREKFGNFQAEVSEIEKTINLQRMRVALAQSAAVDCAAIVTNPEFGEKHLDSSDATKAQVNAEIEATASAEAEADLQSGGADRVLQRK